MMEGAWRIFISRRFAVSLLIIAAGLFLLSAFLPYISVLSPEEIRTLKEQRPYLYRIAEVLSVQGITSSPVFLILPILVFISTLVCTSTRLSVRLKRGEGEIEGKVFKVAQDIIAPGNVEGLRIKFLEAFKGSRWNIREASKQGVASIITSKGSLGFWGSMIFHLGLLLTLLSTLVTALTLFSGEMLLTEGYPNPLKEEGFLKVWRRPFMGVRLPEGSINLENFKAVFKDRKPVDYIATVLVKEKDGSSFLKDIRVNDPLQYYGLQYNIDKYGFAPSFVIKDRDGKILFDGDINLALIGGKEDTFQIPDTDYGIVVRFYPDFVMTNGGPRTKSDIPNNPVFTLSLTRENIAVGGALLPMGKEVEAEDIKITFTGLKYWVHILISRDWGAIVLTIGLIFLAGGLIVRVLFYEKRVNITINEMAEGCMVKVSGYTKYFPAFFEREIKEITGKVVAR